MKKRIIMMTVLGLFGLAITACDEVGSEFEESDETVLLDVVDSTTLIPEDQEFQADETVHLNVVDSATPVPLKRLGVQYRLQFRGRHDPLVSLPSGREMLLSEILRKEDATHRARIDDLLVEIRRVEIRREFVAMGDVTIICGSGEDSGRCIINVLEININLCKQPEVDICEPPSNPEPSDPGPSVPDTGGDIPSDGKG